MYPKKKNLFIAKLKIFLVIDSVLFSQAQFKNIGSLTDYCTSRRPLQYVYNTLNIKYVLQNSSSNNVVYILQSSYCPLLEMLDNI